LSEAPARTPLTDRDKTGISAILQRTAFEEDRVTAYTLTINGVSRKVDVDPAMPLVWVLRDELDLKGTKFGCGVAQCGACTVHINGAPTRSCITPVSSIGTRAITTIESVEQTAVGKKVQAAWLNIDVAQCGYCQAGQIMAATALLTAKPKPIDADIDSAMDGNICRCATYPRIRAAIKEAAGLPTVDARPMGGE
jgi:isoquinoline 1-oxidoreductase subunit alpha